MLLVIILPTGDTWLSERENEYRMIKMGVPNGEGADNSLTTGMR